MVKKNIYIWNFIEQTMYDNIDIKPIQYNEFLKNNFIILYINKSSYYELQNKFIEFINNYNVINKEDQITSINLTTTKLGLITNILLKYSTLEISIPMLHIFLGKNYYELESEINELNDINLYIREIYNECEIHYKVYNDLITNISQNYNPPAVAKICVNNYMLKENIYAINLSLNCETTYLFFCKYFCYFNTIYDLIIPQTYYILHSSLLTHKCSNEEVLKITNSEELKINLKNLKEKNVKKLVEKYLLQVRYLNDCYRYLKKENITFYRDNGDKHFKQFFFGGRTEIYSNVYEKREEFYKFYAWDLPSAYYKTLLELLPTTHPEILDGKTISGLNIHDNYAYICNVTDNNNIVPILPTRKYYNSDDLNTETGVEYPLGTYYGFWWGSELNYFKNLGGIINKIIKVYKFEKYGFMFNDLNEKLSYLETVYSKTELRVLKKIKTCIYGNFSQKEKNYITIEIKHNSTKKYNVKKTTPITNYYFSSYITMKIRLKMHKLIMLLLKYNIKLLCLKVDCIYFFTSDTLINKLKTDNIYLLEIWKNREIIYEDIFFINNKYSFFKLYEEDYYSSNHKKVYSIKSIETLKHIWYLNNEINYNLKGNIIYFDSIINRDWSIDRVHTNPKIYNITYPE